MALLQREDAARLRLRPLVLELRPGFLQLAGGHVPPLGCVGDRRVELLPTLRAGLDLIVQFVPGQFVLLLGGIQFQRAAFQFGSLGIEVGQATGQASQPDAEVVVLIQGQLTSK